MHQPEILAEVRRWLQLAEEDLDGAAEMLRDDSFVPRQVCRLAQQAAEKALRALLAAFALTAPEAHDLDALRNLLPPNSITKRQHPDLAELTQWGVEARLPANWQEATVEEAQRAAHQAVEVFESALSDLFELGIRRNPGPANQPDLSPAPKGVLLH